MTSSADDRQAAQWFAQARAPEQDRPDEQAWLEWIGDADHQRAYEDCELAWEFSAELRDSAQLAALLATADALVNRRDPAPAIAARPRWQVPWWRAGLAASVIAAGAIAWQFCERPTAVHYTTAVGEQRSVTLPDGSTLLLNTDSDVRVELSRHLRRVELMRGEALFSVSHDPGRPFAVHALRGVTTAVGTQFDVEIVSTGAAVSVLEGTVTVGGGDAGIAAPAAVAVPAGRGVGYTATGMVSPLRPAEINRIQGWRAQRIVFNDIPLRDALAEYNRYRRTPIVLADPALGSHHINGVFRIGDEAAFLGAMEQGLHLAAVPGDAQTVLRPESASPP